MSATPKPDTGRPPAHLVEDPGTGERYEAIPQDDQSSRYILRPLPPPHGLGGSSWPVTASHLKARYKRISGPDA